MESGKQYNNAKYWQIGFFSLNNAATNLYLALMGYVSYYANSMAGFGVVLVSGLLTGLNVFDAVTDPVVGFMVDRTKGRFGKFRPFMLCGNIIMAVSAVLLYFTTHEVNHYIRVVYFVLIYGLFILGYTCQTVVAKSGQAVITDNPKQRPVSTYFDSLFIMAAYGGTAVFVANYLVPKYGGFTNEALYQEYVLWVVGLSFICTVLAMIGIAKKDRADILANHTKVPKIKVRDYWEIICHNKPIRMLIIAACTDKFAATVYSHTTVGVMLYGIMMENYGISGLIGHSHSDTICCQRRHTGGTTDGTEKSIGLIYCVRDRIPDGHAVCADAGKYQHDQFFTEKDQWDHVMVCRNLHIIKRL